MVIAIEASPSSKGHKHNQADESSDYIGPGNWAGKRQASVHTSVLLAVTEQNIHIGTAVALFLVHYRSVRAYRKQTHSFVLPIRHLVLGTTLTIISFVCFTIGTYSLVWRSLGVVCIYYGLTVTSYMLKQILGAPGESIIRSRLFATMSVCIVVTILLDAARGTNENLFYYGGSFQPTFVYYFYHAFYYGVLFYLNLRIISVYWEHIHYRRRIGIRNHNDLNVFLRLCCGMTSFLLGATGAGATEVNLLLSVFYGDTYRPTLNAVLFGSVFASVVLLLVGFAPPMLVSHLTRHFDAVLVRRYESQHDRLRYLRDRLVQIVPMVQLPGGELKEARVLVEIGHARRLIGSHIARTGRVSAKAEAERVYRLLQEGVVIRSAGANPPLPKCRYARVHYLTLASHLHAFEQGRSGAGGDMEVTRQ